MGDGAGYVKRETVTHRSGDQPKSIHRDHSKAWHSCPTTVSCVVGAGGCTQPVSTHWGLRGRGSVRGEKGWSGQRDAQGLGTRLRPEAKAVGGAVKNTQAGSLGSGSQTASPCLLEASRC